MPADEASSQDRAQSPLVIHVGSLDLDREHFAPVPGRAAGGGDGGVRAHGYLQKGIVGLFMQ
jgi:hypothetical protein